MNHFAKKKFFFVCVFDGAPSNTQKLCSAKNCNIFSTFMKNMFLAICKSYTIKCAERFDFSF